MYGGFETDSLQYTGRFDLFLSLSGGAAVGRSDRRMDNAGFLLRLPVLGHAGYEHFAGNMLLFLVIGPPMEEKYGSKVLLTGILLTALISGLLQCIFFPSTALLGASGIVFMLVMLSSLAGMKEGRVPLTLILVAILYLGQEVYAALFVQDNVAHFMHLVGGACGTVFGFAAARKKL